MKPRVVWTLQSPTLLNILAKSDQWDLQVADFGDASMMEASQLQAPRWDGLTEGVRMVFVCSPAHVENARKLLPGVPIMLVAHQGYPQKLPACEEACGVITFSNRVYTIFLQETRSRVYCIRPCFEWTGGWEFVPDRCWTMMSRPSTREPIVQAGLETVRRLCHHPIAVYGQAQPDGYLTPDRKKQLLARSSAYVSILPSRSGIGLAQHEAMAAGCPVIGSWWSDLATFQAHVWGAGMAEGFRDYDDFYGLAGVVDRMSVPNAIAHRIAQAQREYLDSKCSLAGMNTDITRLLAAE